MLSAFLQGPRHRWRIFWPWGCFGREEACLATSTDITRNHRSTSLFTLWKTTSKLKARKSNSQVYQKLVSYLPDNPMGLPPQPFGVESLQFILHHLPRCPLNPIVRRDQLGSMQGFVAEVSLSAVAIALSHPKTPQTKDQAPHRAQAGTDQQCCLVRVQVQQLSAASVTDEAGRPSFPSLSSFWRDFIFSHPLD